MCIQNDQIIHIWQGYTPFWLTLPCLRCFCAFLCLPSTVASLCEGACETRVRRSGSSSCKLWELLVTTLLYSLRLSTLIWDNFGKHSSCLPNYQMSESLSLLPNSVDISCMAHNKCHIWSISVATFKLQLNNSQTNICTNLESNVYFGEMFFSVPM